MNKKIFKSVLLLIIVAVVFYGAYRLRNMSDYVSKGKVKITQEELFKGDTKKLEPQLGYFGVADIKIKYNTDKKGIDIYYEEWKNGEIIEEYPLTTLSDGLEEITITAKEDRERNGYDIRTVIYDKSDQMTTSTYISKPTIELKYGTQEMYNSTVDDTEEMGLWGIIGQEDSYYKKAGETVIDIAKRSAWAVVLKIEFNGSEYEVFSNPHQFGEFALYGQRNIKFKFRTYEDIKKVNISENLSSKINIKKVDESISSSYDKKHIFVAEHRNKEDDKILQHVQVQYLNNNGDYIVLSAYEVNNFTFIQQEKDEFGNKVNTYDYDDRKIISIVQTTNSGLTKEYYSYFEQEDEIGLVITGGNEMYTYKDGVLFHVMYNGKDNEENTLRLFEKFMEIY
jgi:hypothetical protein